METWNELNESAGRQQVVRQSAVPVEGRSPDVARLAEELVDAASGHGIALTGDGGLLTELTKQVLQHALEAEMADHLGYDVGDPAGRNGGNSRNGKTPKTVITEVGKVTVDVPRDREGSFEPKVVPKHQRRLTGFNDAVISLYAKGMTTGDIAAHMAEVYDTDISRDMVSTVTAQVAEKMREWQNRPLDAVYPVVIIDAIMMKVRAGTVANRPVYVAMGINLEGYREVLGMWVGPTGGEGAKQWMSVLTDLKNRGILDVCIVCCDGLTGLPDAIGAIWPQAIVQTCVVHLVRNSLRVTSQKDWSKITKGLKEIYTAPNINEAELRFEAFTDQWENRYPAMIDSWHKAWAEFTPFLSFPQEVRSVIYTTNVIESLNARFRAATRRRGHFPDDESALKVLYLASLKKNTSSRGYDRNIYGRVANWKTILNVLLLTYGDRLQIN
jgi:transposase-like protein